MNRNSLNMEITKGNTIELSVAVKIDGVYQNLSGYTIYYTVKGDKDDLDSLAPILDVFYPTGGTSYEFSVSSAVLEAGRYYHEIKFLSPAGSVHSIEGVLIVKQPVRGSL